MLVRLRLLRLVILVVLSILSCRPDALAANKSNKAIIVKSESAPKKLSLFIDLGAYIVVGGDVPKTGQQIDIPFDRAAMSRINLNSLHLAMLGKDNKIVRPMRPVRYDHENGRLFAHVLTPGRYLIIGLPAAGPTLDELGELCSSDARSRLECALMLEPADVSANDPRTTVLRFLSSIQCQRSPAEVADPRLAEARPFPVGRAEYNGYPFGDNRLTGIIRYPAQLDGIQTSISRRRSKYPLVIFNHGEGGSLQNFVPFLEDLARHGVIAVSIDLQAIDENFFEGDAVLNPANCGLLSDESWSVISNVNTSFQQVACAVGARARRLILHLELWKAWSQGDEDSGALLSGGLRGKVDLTRIGLAGHSRGGGTILRTNHINRREGRGYGIKGLFAIAPTDYLRHNPEGIAYLTLMGSNDCDSSHFQGGRIYDRAVRHRDSVAVQLFVRGAAHFPFVTGREGYCVSDFDPLAQQEITRTMSIAFFRRFLVDDAAQNALLRNEATTFSLRAASIRWSYQDPEHLLVDGFEDSPADPRLNSLGGANQPSEFRFPYLFPRPLGSNFLPLYSLPYQWEWEDEIIEPDDQEVVELEAEVVWHVIPGHRWSNLLPPHLLPFRWESDDEGVLTLNHFDEHDLGDQAYNASFFHDTKGLVLGWGLRGPVSANPVGGYGLTVEIPSQHQNASAFRALGLRVAQIAEGNVSDPLNQPGQMQDFDFGLEDALGNSAYVSIAEFASLSSADVPAPPPGRGAPPTKTVLQTVRVPFGCYRRMGIDLTQIRRIHFRFDQRDTGLLAIDDLQFTK